MSEVLRGLYASATGMTARILQQDLIANNLANVSTNGYKRSGALNTQFDEVLLMNLSQRDPRSSRVGPLSRGVRTYESYVDFSHGTVTETGDPLDLALDGDGFFVVLQDGELRYILAPLGLKAGDTVVKGTTVVATFTSNASGLARRVVLEQDNLLQFG